MDQKELVEIGLICYGKSWQKQFAEAIGVNHKTFNSWATGRRSVAYEYHDKIRSMPKTRLKEIEKYVKRR